jgi:hypothetical protein
MKTIKRVQSSHNVTKGWKQQKPSSHERTMMLKRCGKKCFLGSNKSYPICKKNTCKISSQGVYSAYIRSRQYHKKNISQKAKRILTRMHKYRGK